MDNNSQYFSQVRINRIRKMENDTIYHHVKNMMRFGQLTRILPINIDQDTQARQIEPNGNSGAGNHQQTIESRFNIKSICSFKHSQLQFVLNIIILMVIAGLVCYGQAFMFNLQTNGIQIIGFSVFAITLVLSPIVIVFYCNKNTQQV